jgi:hypothetical protein
MRVIKNFGGDAPYGIIPYIQKILDNLSNENSKDLFFNGVQFIDAPYMLGEYMEYDRKALLAHWSPCEFLLKKDYYYLDAYEHFTEVYCVCPFTCAFMNKHFGYEKFIYIPYPYTNYSLDSFGNYDAVSSWFGSINEMSMREQLMLLVSFLTNTSHLSKTLGYIIHMNITNVRMLIYQPKIN